PGMESLMGATVGWYAAEGGEREQGARAILAAARVAAESGFMRAALRLAAAAVQYDPAPATRAAAAKVARAGKRHSVPPPPPGVTVLSVERPSQVLVPR